MRRRRLGLFGLVGTLGWACLPDNPPLDEPADADDDDDDDSSGDGVVSGGGAVLGCPSGTCTLVLTAQTLDDRIEVFAPDDPDGVVWRGAIDLDFKPNECMGCGLGDYGGDRLDEPFGVAIAGGFLHVIAGHYPTPELGTLVSYPIELFAERTAGERLEASEYFANGSFFGDVVGTPLEQLEPTFMASMSGRLVIGTFNNNLFSTEDTWVNPGLVLILDAADPAREVGVIDLADLEGGSCNAAAQVIELSPGTLAVACDGNESVAVLDVPMLADPSPAAAASSASGRLCSLPAAMSNRRVRYLAPDGDGGFIVGEGPTPLDPLSSARLWQLGPDCSMRGLVTFGENGDGRLGEILAVPGQAQTWMVAVGALGAQSEARGIYAVRNSGGELEACGPLDGLTDQLRTEADDPLEPFAIAFDATGEHLAIGAGPLDAPLSGPAFGKVLWSTVSLGDDVCASTLDVIDLTDGSRGAPAVDPNNPDTFRRAPSVVEIVEVAG